MSLQTGPARYGLAIAAVLLAATVRAALSPWMPHTMPFVTFYLAVMVAAWMGGLGPGLAASLLSTLLGDFLFFEPIYSLSFDTKYVLSLSVFGTESVAITLLTNKARRTDEVLRQKEVQFRTAFELASIGKAQVDAQTGRLREANQAFCQLTGYTREELLRMTPQDLTHPADRPADAAGFGALLRGEIDAYGVEKRYIRKDSGVIWVQVEAALLRDAQGRPYRTIAAILDITARKQAEAALKRSEERWNLLLSGSTDGIWEWDIRNRTVFLSDRWKRMRGYEDADIGTAESEWASRIHPEDAARVMDTITAYLGRVIPEYHCEYRTLCKDGSSLWVLDRGVAIWDDHGPLLMIGSETDITARTTAEQALRDSEERLSGIVSTAMDAIISVDSRYRITLFNDAAEQLFGCRTEEVIGSPLDRFIPERFRREHRSHVAEFGRTGTTARRMGQFGTVYGLRTSGEEFPIEASISQLPIKGEKLYTVILRDITERLAREAELQAWRNEMELRVEERTREVRSYQDRLRALATELNLIQQREQQRLAGELHDHLAQMLVLSRLNLARARQLTASHEQVSELLKKCDEVIGECLAYTRTLVADLSPQVLHQFGLVAALHWLAQRMHRFEMTVEVATPAESLDLVQDHAILLFQSVRELLMNIRKHARTSHAWVSVTHHDSLLMIVVRDQGVGFDPRTIEAAVAESSFGLFSVRERMRSLGGSFHLDSQPGIGTTATLSLPLSPLPSGQATDSGRTSEPETVPADTAGDVQGRPIRVLLVDDHAMMREGLHSVLKNYSDMEVVGEASNGREAVARVGEVTPDVIVMDMNMPVMNGIDATREIKMRHPHICILGVSVNARDNEAEMLRAGASFVLTKEAAVEKLHGAICRVVKESH